MLVGPLIRFIEAGSILPRAFGETNVALRPLGKVDSPHCSVVNPLCRHWLQGIHGKSGLRIQS